MGIIVRQPAPYRVWFATPQISFVAEYRAGNTYATVTRQTPDFFAFLTRLHLGTGAGVAWILLVDTLAGGLIAFAVSGMLLWSRLDGPRLLALGLAGAGRRCLRSRGCGRRGKGKTAIRVPIWLHAPKVYKIAPRDSPCRFSSVGRAGAS